MMKTMLVLLGSVGWCTAFTSRTSCAWPMRSLLFGRTAQAARARGGGARRGGDRGALARRGAARETTARAARRQAPRAALPAVVVFDLDGCLWFPDMYMLWGSGGAPFTGPGADGALVDCGGRRVTMLGAVPELLGELHADPRWARTVVAIASCTDEPAWAQECLRKFKVAGDGDISLKDVMQVEEITKVRGANVKRKAVME